MSQTNSSIPPPVGPRRYCVKMSIAQILEMPNDDLVNKFQNVFTGETFTPREAKESALLWRNEGLTWGPPCNCQTPVGNCLGHTDPQRR